MSNIFDSVTEKLGVNKEGAMEKAKGFLDQQGGGIGGLLGKVGLGGNHEEAAPAAEAKTGDEATEEADESEEDTTEDGDDSEEESTEDDEDSEEASDDDSDDTEASEEEEESDEDPDEKDK
jgi:hypothetical protein